MYENLVNQSIKKSLIADIKNNLLPGALLFSGSEACGKLTTALETARILSCRGEEKGKWVCNCSSCLSHKALTCTNLMLLGPRDCFLEIQAAKVTFEKAYSNNESFIDAARYLFLRSIRKLTLRFNEILWEGERDFGKIGTLLEEINDNLELLDFPKELPPLADVSKICEKLVEKCEKLEKDYLYDSIPINQIRNMEQWAHIKTEEGKKTVIIENADRMLPGVRNALLKILEEPPADCIFILLTSKRNAIMQTILSRVRTYNFRNRTIEQQNDVITRVFHNNDFNGSINDYLLTFLPVSPDEIKKQADEYFNSICKRTIPDITTIVKKCDNFVPRVELRLFLTALIEKQKKMIYSQAGAEIGTKCLEFYRQAWENVTMYNQTPNSALEILLRDLSSLNVQNGGIFARLC